jgi:ABC-type Co2+ transport system permease subunit
VFGKLIGLLVAIALGFFGAKATDQNNGWLPMVADFMIACAIAWSIPLVLGRYPHPSRRYTVAFLVGVLVWVVLNRVHGM